MARYSKKSQDTVEEAMHKEKRGKLRSGRSCKKVTSRKQAIRKQQRTHELFPDRDSSIQQIQHFIKF